jgi:hypothetical protein
MGYLACCDSIMAFCLGRIQIRARCRLRSDIPDEIWLSLRCHADHDELNISLVRAANAKEVDRGIRFNSLDGRISMWQIAQIAIRECFNGANAWTHGKNVRN